MEKEHRIEEANLLLVYEGLKLSVKTGQIKEQDALDAWNHWFPDFKIEDFEGLSDPTYQHEE